MIESIGGSYNPTSKKDVRESFEKVRDVLNSVENKPQLEVALKLINNFIERYKINNTSPEYQYLERILKAKKLQLGIGRVRRRLRSDENEDPSVRLMLKKIIREEVDDLEWIKTSKPFVKTSDLQVGQEYVARNVGERTLNGGEIIDAEGKTFVVLNKRNGPLWVDILWVDMDDDQRREDFLTGLSKGDWEVIYSSEPFEGDEEENLEEEGSMWGNDENWGTDKSYWGKDPNWGEGGSYDGGGDSGGGNEGGDF